MLALHTQVVKKTFQVFRPNVKAAWYAIEGV